MFRVDVVGDGPSTPNFDACYNIAPTNSVPVVRTHPETGVRHIDLLHWGLIPAWSPDRKVAFKMINARAETVADTRSFRGAFKARRCLIPADGFFEWKAMGGKTKQPYAIGMTDGQPFALAGLWEGWKDPVSGEIVRSCTIITTDANELTAEVHDRMPVILAPEDWPAWLGEVEASPDERKALLRPYPAERMRVWPVGTAVGNVRNQGAELIERIAIV